MFGKRVRYVPWGSGLRSARSTAWRAVTAAGIILLTGCWRQPYTETGVAGLERFESPEAFKAYLADQAARPWRFFDGGMLSPDAIPLAAPGLPVAGAAPAPEIEADYSTTNLQEEGVDESDVVKNDATYLYALGGGGLRIVRAVPANSMEVVGSLELPGQPESLYLRGDQLIAVGRGESWDTTLVSLIDVADRTAPSIGSTVKLEGDLATSRLIESKLHLVIRADPALPEDAGPLAIRFADLNDLIPDVIVTPAGREPVARNLVEWQDFYHPIDPDGYSVTALVTLEVDDPSTPLQSVGVMADAGTIYACPGAIYLTDWGYDYNGGLRETTDIYKFDLTGEGPVLAAAGSIPGRLLNRFSLGEHEGYLRAATTTRDASVAGLMPTSNNVYVLGVQEGELKIVGRVEGIAPGESIFSARFLGDRGFLVTFEKVDPLFTMDLSDPTSPRMVGELKVPGYSDYLHPLGENHLLAIGKDASDAGSFSWYRGVQISLFDVTDFAQPQRIDVEVVGERGTRSDALEDPHAFTYFGPAEMLAVPMTIAEGAGPEPWQEGTATFRGLCLYRVAADTGIESAGRVETGWAGEPNLHESGWIRSAFIGDYVYTVTGSAVRTLPLNDLAGTPIVLSLE